MKTLIVIDMQNDFIYGSLGTKEAQKIVLDVKNKIQEYYKNRYEIIFTRDTHYGNYLNTNEGKNLPVEHCLYDTHGWEIADGLTVPNCRYVNKETFGWVNWGNWYYGDLEIVGVCTDICVVSNALMLRAMFPEVNITVDASCCAGTTPENHKAALQVMKSCQINVIGE